MSTPVPHNDIVVQPSPSPGDAIHQVVQTVSEDFGKAIASLKEALSIIEQEYLESAARAKGALNGHVEVCSKLNGEVARLREVVTEIKTKADDADLRVSDPPRLTGQDAIDAKWDHDRDLRKHGD